MTTDDAPAIEIGRYALRTFDVVSSPDGPWMSSVGVTGRHWHGGVCEAICMAGNRHASPHEGCSCGIYGTLSLGALRRQYPDHANDLVAVMAAEGDTIIGGTGLQTAYARIVAYWAPRAKICEIAHSEFPNAEHFVSLNMMLGAYNLPHVEEGYPPLALRIPHTLDDIRRAGRLNITIHNPAAGHYTELELSDGTKCSITPTTASGWGTITLIISLGA